MTFSQQSLSVIRPDSIRAVNLPRRGELLYSPADWLLPDRFSDGQEAGWPLLDPTNRIAFRPAGFRWDQSSASGGGRYQGGTIKGIVSKLAYIASIGATALWIGPIFKLGDGWQNELVLE